MLHPFAKLVLLLVSDDVLEEPNKSSLRPIFPIYAELSEGLLSVATFMIGLDLELLVAVKECLCYNERFELSILPMVEK